jgi:CheY-like chemotaxis protein
MANILLAEDERNIRFLLASVLTNFGHDVIEAADGQVALSLLQNMPFFDILITDLRMPGMNGLQLIDVVRKDDRKLSIIAISAYHNTLVEALAKGAHYVLQKPFSHKQLVEIVHTIVT